MGEGSTLTDVLVPVATALIGALTGGGAIWAWLGSGVKRIEERQKRQNMALRAMLLWVVEDQRLTAQSHPDLKRSPLSTETILQLLDL